MKRRTRDEPTVREIFAIAKSRPDTAWRLGQRRTPWLGTGSVPPIAANTVSFQEMLVKLCASRERSPEPRILGIDYRDYLMREAEYTRAVFDLHEKIREGVLLVEIIDGSFVLGLLDLAIGVHEGLVELRRCKLEECRSFLIEDRNVSDLTRKQKFCCRKCRQQWHNRKYGPAYFADKKRESTARR